jgi:uncharacterized membrane protein YbhN (UPF0104 family)
MTHLGILHLSPATRATISYLIGIIIFLVFVIGIEHYIGWQTLLTPWRQVSWQALGITCSLVFLSYGVRAIRVYSYFLPLTQGKLTACMKLTLLHNFFNNLLPMRTGEASFPVLMTRYFGIPLTHSVAALLWLRLLDLHTLCSVALFMLGQLWLDWRVNFILNGVWLVLPYLSFLALRWLMTLETWQSRRITQIIAGLPQTHSSFWQMWVWTVLNWGVKIAVFAWILQLFAPLTFPIACLGAIGGELTSVLPVHGVAGAGTYAAGVVAGLLPFGVSAREALQAAVNLHLFFLSLSIIGGLVGLLLKTPTIAPTTA